MIFSPGHGSSGTNYLCRLVSSEEGHLLYPKDRYPKCGDVTGGHKLECLQSESMSSIQWQWKIEQLEMLILLKFVGEKIG